MSKRPRQPTIPRERSATLRREIAALLERGAYSAREISTELGIRERDVPDHLAHIRTSLERTERALQTEPSECESCGFVFRDRTRLTRPGRCPACRGTRIAPPRFSIAPASERADHAV